MNEQNAQDEKLAPKLAPKLVLWDLAGPDALSVALHVWGECIGRLAAFQSLETELQGQACSVLRLCDRNFRILYPHPQDSLDPIDSLDQCIDAHLKKASLTSSNHAHPIHYPIQYWIKQYSWLSRLCLPASQLLPLTQQATVRPPHRLADLPNHQSVPACLSSLYGEIPLLIWQHPVQRQPTLELHTAHKTFQPLLSYLSHHRIPYQADIEQIAAS